MTAKLLLSVCGAALLAIGSAGAQTIQSEPPAATPPSLESPPAGPQRTYPAPAQPDSGRLLPAPDSPAGVAPERADPGRDCAAARTRVQETICKNRDLVQFDRDVARFAGTLPGGANQGAWVKQLESCESAAPTNYDGPIYRCLNARYKARLVQLSRMAGGTLAGQYRLAGRSATGSMTVVEWPQQGRASVIFDMVTADGARACGIRMDARIGQGVIEGAPNGLPECRVSVQLDRGTANVQSNGCTALCEMGERVDGTYMSLGTIAPAAPPSRRPPAPATPRSTNPRY
jgi:uncharacterized protein